MDEYLETDEHFSHCYHHGRYFNPEGDECPRCQEEEEEEAGP